MKINPVYEKEIVSIILYTSVFFIILAVVLIVFFYFSRKKIIQKELEKKDLEIQHQRAQLRAVIITQEEERKRIAQDLHDDISSKLNIVSLNSHLLKTPNLSLAETNEITNNIIELTAKALGNTRRIAHDLLPPVLDKFGLHAGVEELCAEFNSSKAVNVSYQNNITFNEADKEKHLHVFRILQELMNNSVRHGKATEIKLIFDEVDGVNRCKYTDNGLGFDMEDPKNQNGLGMKNIESRVDFLNGSLAIVSAKNQGIDVLIHF
jgi:signal transduction histidine kinase